MKKYIFLLLSALLLPLQAHAALYGFMDNKYYDISGELQVFGFMDGSFYNMSGQRVYLVDGSFTTMPPKDQPVSVVTSTPITVSPMPSGTALIYTPPVTNNNVTTPIQPMPAFTPYASEPYQLNTVEVWNTEQTVKKVNRIIAIDLTRHETDLEQLKNRGNYRLWCKNPEFPQGAFLDEARMNKYENGQLNGLTAVATSYDFGPGAYECKFVFQLPEGKFESGVISYNLE